LGFVYIEGCGCQGREDRGQPFQRRRPAAGGVVAGDAAGDGIPVREIAEYMEFSPKMALQMEQPEQQNTITLKRLGELAWAMQCDLVLRDCAVAAVARGPGVGDCGEGAVEEEVFEVTEGREQGPGTRGRDGQRPVALGGCLQVMPRNTRDVDLGAG
jgi:hypothetical protein